MVLQENNQRQRVVKCYYYHSEVNYISFIPFIPQQLANKSILYYRMTPHTFLSIHSDI